MTRGRSIRVRIARWHSAVFLPFFALLALAAYWFLSLTSRERVDEFLAESAATIAATIEFERNRGADDTLAMQSVVASIKLHDVTVYLLDQSSARAYTSNDGEPPGTPPRAAPGTTRTGDLRSVLARIARTAPRDPTLQTLVVGGIRMRIFTLPYAVGDRPVVIAVAQGMVARARMLRDARIALAITFPLVLALATFGGLWLAGKSLAPVDAMTARARQIGATNLHERLPGAHASDELGRLATVFNELLARLEQAFEAQSRFAADASHEMRTPVAVISGEAELALARDDRTRDELREALHVIRDQSLRLRSVVDDLFFLARADGGEPILHPAPLYLDELLEESVRALRTVAAARDIRVQLSVPGEAPAVGDETLLRRAVDNLLVNAVKYSRPGGTVDVQLADGGAVWHVDVRDNGPGIAPEARDRLFERFFRAADARAATSVDGAGLGLAITRWIARAHHGDALLAATSPEGSTFRLVIPKQAHDVARGLDSGVFIGS